MSLKIILTKIDNGMTDIIAYWVVGVWLIEMYCVTEMTKNRVLVVTKEKC
jgi:hypothetical protein